MGNFICDPNPSEGLLEILIRLLTGKKKSFLEQVRDRMIR